METRSSSRAKLIQEEKEAKEAAKEKEKSKKSSKSSGDKDKKKKSSRDTAREREESPERMKVERRGSSSESLKDDRKRERESDSKSSYEPDRKREKKLESEISAKKSKSSSKKGGSLDISPPRDTKKTPKRSSSEPIIIKDDVVKSPLKTKDQIMKGKKLALYMGGVHLDPSKTVWQVCLLPSSCPITCFSMVFFFCSLGANSVITFFGSEFCVFLIFFFKVAQEYQQSGKQKNFNLNSSGGIDIHGFSSQEFPVTFKLIKVCPWLPHRPFTSASGGAPFQPLTGTYLQGPSFPSHFCLVSPVHSSNRLLRRFTFFF